MKQAIATIGSLKYLATKTADEQSARVIREFKFGSIDTFLSDQFQYESGTEICIVNLNPIVNTHQGVMTRSIVPYLGARYRNFLKPDNREVEIFIEFINQYDGSIQNSWPIHEVKPIYFHPGTRSNKPVIEKHDLRGASWEAKLTFGYAPDNIEEYEELGFEEPNKFHPYRVSINTQGLDILLHKRVILFHQLHEVGIIESRHNRYNRVRGEIELISGFSTAITKNAIIADKNFQECIERITDILRGEAQGPGNEKKNYLHTKTYPDQIPERLLRDRLRNWLQTNPLAPRKTVHTEYVLEGIEGYIDVYTDQDAWEIKIEQANALSVYQLFMYMDIGKIDKGFVVAPSFSTGAEAAANHIREAHNKDIQLIKIDDLPITNSPSREEREKYY